MHAGRPLVEDLHAVRAAVPGAGVGVLGENQGEGDVSPGILWPALKDGDARQGRVVADDDLFARAVLDGFRKGAGQVLKLGKHPELSQQPLRGLEIQDPLEVVGHVRQCADLEGEIHPRLAAEGVDQDRHDGTLHLFEKQRRAAPLANPIRDLGDLQDRIHLGSNTAELAGPLQGGEELP